MPQQTVVQWDLVCNVSLVYAITCLASSEDLPRQREGYTLCSKRYGKAHPFIRVQGITAAALAGLCHVASVRRSTKYPCARRPSRFQDTTIGQVARWVAKTDARLAWHTSGVSSMQVKTYAYRTSCLRIQMIPSVGEGCCRYRCCCLPSYAHVHYSPFLRTKSHEDLLDSL